VPGEDRQNPAVPATSPKKITLREERPTAHDARSAVLRGWRILSDHQSRRADRVAMRARNRPDLVDMEYVAQSISFADDLRAVICVSSRVASHAVPNQQLELGGGLLALRCVICVSRE